MPTLKPWTSQEGTDRASRHLFVSPHGLQDLSASLIMRSIAALGGWLLDQQKFAPCRVAAIILDDAWFQFLFSLIVGDVLRGS